MIQGGKVICAMQEPHPRPADRQGTRVVFRHRQNPFGLACYVCTSAPLRRELSKQTGEAMIRALQ